MFSGIVSHLGKINNIEGSTFDFGVPLAFSKQIKKGSSISVNGVCLTARRVGVGYFRSDLMPETLKRTAFSGARVADVVNLELSVAVDGRFDGHIVLGHVDCTAILESVEQDGNSNIFKFLISPLFSKYLVVKGPICINGVSLTLTGVSKKHLIVAIIPFTLKNTNFRNLKVGDKVNIEVDVLAKYIEKFTRGKNA